MASRSAYAQFPQYQYQKIDHKFIKYTNIPFYTKPKPAEEAEAGDQSEPKEPAGNAVDGSPAPDEATAEPVAPADVAESKEAAPEESGLENVEAESSPPPQEALYDGQNEVSSEPQAESSEAEVPPVAPEAPTASSETQAESVAEEASASAEPEPEPVTQEIVEPPPSEPPAEVIAPLASEETPVAPTDKAVDEAVKLAPEEPSGQEKAPAKAKKGKKVQVKVPPKQNTKKGDNTEKAEKPKEKTKAAVKVKKGTKSDKKKTAKAAAAADTPPPVEEAQTKSETESPQPEAPAAEIPKNESEVKEENQTPASAEAVEAVPENPAVEIPPADASESIEALEPGGNAAPNHEEVVQPEQTLESNGESESKPADEGATSSESLPPSVAEGEASKESEALPPPTHEAETLAESEAITQPESLELPAADESNTETHGGTTSEESSHTISDSRGAPTTGDSTPIVETVVAPEKTNETESEAQIEPVKEEAVPGISAIDATEKTSGESEAHISDNVKQEPSAEPNTEAEPEQTSPSEDATKSAAIPEEPVAAQEQETETALTSEDQPEINQNAEVVAEEQSDYGMTKETEQVTEDKQDLTDKPTEPNIADITEPPVDLTESDSTTVAEVSEETKSATETADVSIDSNTTTSNDPLPSTDIDVASTGEQNSSDSNIKTISIEPIQEAIEPEVREPTSTTTEQEQTESLLPDSDVQKAAIPNSTTEVTPEIESDTRTTADLEPDTEANPETSLETSAEMHEEASLEANLKTYTEANPSASSSAESRNDIIHAATNDKPEDIPLIIPDETVSKDNPVSENLDEVSTLVSTTDAAGESVATSDTVVTDPESVNSEENPQTKAEEQSTTDSHHQEKEAAPDEHPHPNPDSSAEVKANETPLELDEPAEAVDVPQAARDQVEAGPPAEETSEKASETEKHDIAPETDSQAIAPTISDTHTEAKVVEEVVEQPENLVEEPAADIAAVQELQPNHEVQEPIVDPIMENIEPSGINHATKSDDVDNRSIAAVCDDQVTEREQEEAKQENTVQEDSPRGISSKDQEPAEATSGNPKNQPEPATPIIVDTNPDDAELPKSDQEVKVSETADPLETPGPIDMGTTADVPSHDTVPEVIPISISNDREREKKRHKRRSTAEHHHETHSESKSKNHEDPHGHSTKTRATDSHFRRHKTADANVEANPKLTSRRDHHDPGHVKVSKSQNHHSRPENERKSSSRPSPTSDEPQRPKHERIEGSYRPTKSGPEKDANQTSSFGLNAIGRALRPKLFTGNKAQSEIQKSSRDMPKHETQEIQEQPTPAPKSSRSPVEPKLKRSHSEHKPSRSEEEAAHRIAHTRRRERGAKDAANADAARRSARREAHRLEHDKDQQRTETEKSDRKSRKHAERRNSKEATSIPPIEEGPIEEGPHDSPDNGEAVREPSPPENKPDQVEEAVHHHHHHRHHHHRTSSHGNMNTSHSPEKAERPEAHRSHRRQSYIGDHPRKAKVESNGKEHSKKSEAAAPVGLLKRIFGN